MIKLWNRHTEADDTMIDLTAAMEGQPTRPLPRRTEPRVLALRVEKRDNRYVLCVENRGDSVVRHVFVRTIASVGPGTLAGVVSDSTDPVHLRPEERTDFRLFLPPDCARAMRCQVSWRDGQGQHITFEDVPLLDVMV